jgi:hypothetical protein
MINVRSSVFSISYFAIPPYLQDKAIASKKVLMDIFLYQVRSEKMELIPIAETEAYRVNIEGGSTSIEFWNLKK